MNKNGKPIVTFAPEKVDFSGLTLRKKEVDVNKFEQENIAQQYDSIADGIQKEVIQNSWDARLDKTTGKGWKLELSYDPVSHVLRAEDFGTTGMDDQDWKNFNGLGLTQKKAGVTLGSKGQGKAVLSAAADYVITETIRDTHRSGIWVGGQYGDYQRATPQLDHQGTLITACSVREIKDEDLIHEDLANDDLMVRFIQLTWDDIVREDNAEIVYKSSKATRVPLLTVPQGTAIIDQYSPPNLTVKQGRKLYGEITDVVVFCADNELPEDMQGIAVSVKGQTIFRYLPPALGPQSKRIYGRCKAEFLAPSELPNHSGFRNTAPWTQTRAVLRNLMMKYTEKFVKSRKKVDSKRTRFAGDVLDEVNQILEKVTELDPGGGTTPRPPPPPVPLPAGPYIVAIVMAKREYKRGETAHIDVATANGSTTQTFDNWTVMTEIYDPNHLLVFSKAEKHSFVPNDASTFGFDYAIPPSAAQGRYSITIQILDSSLAQQGVEASSFLVEPPPRQPRKRQPGQKPGKGKSRGLRDISLLVPEESGVPESLYDEQENAVVVNILHPSYEFAMRGGEATEKIHMLKCVANELLFLKAQRDMAERGDSMMSPDEVEKYHEGLMHLHQRFFECRAIMQLPGTPEEDAEPGKGA